MIDNSKDLSDKRRPTMERCKLRKLEDFSVRVPSRKREIHRLSLLELWVVATTGRGSPTETDRQAGRD